MIMSMYKKLIGSLTISLLFLLSATPSFAQQNDVKVTGKITDGSGAPLAGVVVVIEGRQKQQRSRIQYARCL